MGISPDGRRVAFTWLTYCQLQLPDSAPIPLAFSLRWADTARPRRLHSIGLPVIERGNTAPVDLLGDGAYALIDGDWLVHLESGRKIRLSGLLGYRPLHVAVRKDELLCVMEAGNHVGRCCCRDPHHLKRIPLRSGRAGAAVDIPVAGTGPFQASTFSPDGRYLVLKPVEGTASRAHLPALLHVETNTWVPITFPPHHTTHVSWQGDSSRFLLSSPDRVALFRLDGRQKDLTPLLRHLDKLPWDLQWSSDANCLFGGISKIKMTIEPAAVTRLEAALAPFLPPGHKVQIVELLCAGWIGFSTQREQDFSSWRSYAASHDLTDVRELTPFAYPLLGSPVEPVQVAVDSSGKLIVRRMADLPPATSPPPGTPTAPASPAP